jgi:hypothetical protein
VWGAPFARRRPFAQHRRVCGRPRMCSFSLAGRTRTRSSTRRVGLVGHSAGAQAMLRPAAQPGAWATHSCCSTRHRTIPRDAVFRTAGARDHRRHRDADNVDAGRGQPSGDVALCDTLVRRNAPTSPPELGHDEFISQGQQRSAHRAFAAGGPAQAVKVELAARYRRFANACCT